MSEILSSVEREKRSVFHSWSAQASINPLMVASAYDSTVVDEDGKEYLDFSSQLVNTNIGHQRAEVVDAIVNQARTLTTIAPQHGNRARYEAAEKILAHSFSGADKVFFTNGGTEAVEHAVRMARLVTGKPKVLAAYRSYHGATATSINLTGDHRRWAVDSASAGVVERALAHLEQVISFEGPATIAALILESIPGTAGIMVPPPGYLAGVRALCTKYNIVYIADEVMAGFGRAGSWFAYDQFDIAPDLVTFAKGVNSGYVPLGGVIINETISHFFNDRVYPGGLTYSGHPLACAAAVATMTFMEEHDVPGHAKRIGEEILGPGLRALQDAHPVIGEVRGRGVFFALDLVSNRETKEPLAPYGGSSPAMAELGAACRREGLLPFMNYHRLHVVPPCTVSEVDAREGLARLDRALSAIDGHYQG